MSKIKKVGELVTQDTMRQRHGGSDYESAPDYHQPLQANSWQIQAWAALSQIFGQRLLNEYGDEPPELWRQEMEDLTQPVVEAGVDRLKRSGNAHPPTLSEFSNICRQWDGRHHGQKVPEERHLVDRLEVERHEARLKNFLAIKNDADASAQERHEAWLKLRDGR